PNIVLADAPNLDVAAQRTAFGIWFNQGEVCTAGSRLIVEDRIKDAFLEKVMAIGQKMMPGDPLDPKTQMGAMVDETQTKRVMGYGLASAIFTSDINKAFKFAKGLRAGSVWVNTYDGGDITTPFGGYKQSGIGRDKSLHAFDKFTQVKTTWIQLG